MDILSETNKLNTIIEHDANKDLLEITIWLAVDRGALEEMIEYGTDSNNNKPMSFKGLVRELENDLTKINNHNYNHRKMLPWWAKYVYGAEIKGNE